MRGVAGQILAVTVTVLVVACSHHGRSSAGSSPASGSCSAPVSAPRNDVTQRVIVAKEAQADLVSSLERRLRLMGADCPEAQVTAATTDNGLPIPPGAATLHMRWLKQVGDDPTRSAAEASFLLRPGDLSLRTVSSETPGPCTGNPNLTGVGPADITVGGGCLHLSGVFIDHLHPTRAAVIPTADPFTWTVTLTFDQPTRRRAATALRPLFAAIDGFPLGRADLAGGALTATGRYDGGGTEARADASNAQAPLPAIEGYGVTS